jgi:uncharacterized membrane protein YfcA
MIYVLFMMICLLASIVGAICGIGGGIIIKPVLDSFGLYNISTISFLSGCTVLSMSTYSVIISGVDKKSDIDYKIATPLAIGAVIGGAFGKILFQVLLSRYNQNSIGAVQAAALIIITIGTLIYTIFKSNITTYKTTNMVACIIIGVVLGIMSSFLGIGGGPINLVVLYFFFSMPIQTAAQNSLYIILFSQLSSLVNSILTNKVPTFSPLLLILMSLGGILGGYFGHRINKIINSKIVEYLFIGLMIVIIVLNINNLIKYTF